MRTRNFSARTPFTITPARVASLTMPSLRTSERVFPCRSAVKMAIAFSSAERYNDTLNESGACFPWRLQPSDFLGRAMNSSFCGVLYHKVCVHRNRAAPTTPGCVRVRAFATQQPGAEKHAFQFTAPAHFVSPRDILHIHGRDESRPSRSRKTDGDRHQHIDSW